MVMRLLTGTSGHMSSKQQKEFEARVCTEGETIVAAFRTQRELVCLHGSALVAGGCPGRDSRATVNPHFKPVMDASHRKEMKFLSP